MHCAFNENVAGSGLVVGQCVFNNIENKKNRNGKLDKLISQLEKEVKLNSAKFLDLESIHCYREFIRAHQSIIESQDIAPAILVGLILNNGRLPTISRVVDAMNFISITMGVTISIWDQDKIKGDILYKLSQGVEKYWPFMGEEVVLMAGELAAFDDEKVLCLVRYRDSKYAPVNLETKNLVIHIQGVHGVKKALLEEALDQLALLLNETVGGNMTSKHLIF